MRKIVSLCICCILALCLCSCGGNVKNVKTHKVDSELYTQDDINAAIKTIKEEFNDNWKGCTLTDIYYAGDKSLNSYQASVYSNDADEVIVLLSSFDVDSSGGDGSLNPNSTYDDFRWILVRKKGSKWKHVDGGY